jgi:hypothetical protein
MQEATQLADAEEALDRDHHDRAERRLRQVLEERREEGPRQEDETGGGQRRELRAPAGAVGRGGLARAAGLHEAGRQSREQVGGAEPHEVAVRID